MNLHVELADGTTQTISISSSSTIEDVVETIANDTKGLKAVADCLSEYSLAHRDKNSAAWINVSWLDPTLPVLEQTAKPPSNTTLLFRKKYFSTNNNFRHLDSSPALRQNIYAQLRHTFIAGLYKCSTFQALQIAAMVAKVEFSDTRLGVAGTLQMAGSLKQVLPPKFSGVLGIEQLIVKATRNISHLSEEATQMAFIQRLQRLETFGLAFFTVVFEEGQRQCEGLLGIGAENIFKIDREEMESLAQWETANLSNYYFDRNSFTMVLGSDEYVTMATMHGHMISEFLSGVKEVTCNGKLNKVVKPVENGIVGKRRGLDHDWKQQKIAPPRVAPKPRLKPSRTQPELRNLQQHQEPNMQSISDTNLVLPAPSPLSKKPRLLPKPVRKPHYPDPLTQLPTIPSPTTSSNQDPVEYLVPILSPTSTSSEPDYAEVDNFSGKVQGFVGPASPSGVLSRQRGGRHMAVKRRLSKTTDDSSPSPPLGRHGTNSPPLTKGKAKAPPRPPLPQLTPKQGRSSPHRRAPSPSQERTPSPQRERTPSPPHRRAPPPPHRKAPPQPQDQAPPPPQERAPPPPQERTPSPPQERAPSPPRRRPPPQKQGPPPPQKRAPPPPQERAPPPPQEQGPPFSPTESIYDTVSDDPTELSNILGDTDLLKDVRWSQHDENPIYDLVAANEAQTLLRNSDVTFKTLSASFKRQMKLRQVGEAKQKSPVPVPRRSGGNRDQSVSSKAAERTNSNQPHVPGVTKRVEMEGSDRLTASPPPVPQRTYKQLSSYAQPQIGTATEAVSVREVEDGYTNPEQFHILSERHRFHSDSVVNSKPRVVRVENNREEFGSGDTEGAGYAILENVTAVGMRRRLKSEGDLMEALVEGEGEAEAARGEGEPQKADFRPPKPPRMRRRKEEPFQKLQRRVEAVVGPDTGKQKARLMKPGEIFKDYAILLKEFRMFAIKLPTGVVHIDLVNLSSPVQKLTARLCQLLHAEDPDMYSMYVEGASLTNITEHDDSSRGASGRSRPRTTALDYFTSLNFSTSLPDQGTYPILLDPRLSFRDHGITTTRILALKPKPSCHEMLPRYQILVPDWVRFHQCWLNVVQGGQPCSLQDATKLAALQYQAYFLDRTELNSVIGFCKSTEFLPLEHASVKGIEEKVFSEQQLLEGYTHKQAQDCYIHASCSLPTYGSVFFPCKEVKKRFLQNNKLTPILIGISREGITRVDPKTKEVLDLWQYQVLKNWGFSGDTFVLDFADTSYPIKTNQARWIADLINFHIEAIARDEGYPPPPPQKVFHPTSSSPPLPRPVSSQQGIIQQHYEMNTEYTERIYEKLFPVSSLPPEQPPFSSFSPGSHNTPEPTLPSSAHHHYYILEQNSSHNVASPTSSEERVYDVPEVVIPLENTVQNDTDDEDPTYDDVIPVIH